jgi:hypothetical protein
MARRTTTKGADSQPRPTKPTRPLDADLLWNLVVSDCMNLGQLLGTVYLTRESAEEVYNDLLGIAELCRVVWSLDDPSALNG